MTAKNLAASNPNSCRLSTHAEAARQIKAKYVPRAPKEGEVLFVLGRPQVGAHTFLEFARGDLVSRAGDVDYVVEAAKPGYTRSGEGYKKWEQIVVARPATEKDQAAVAAQRSQQQAASQAVMDRMMSS